MRAKESKTGPDQDRRSFLLLLPLGVFTGVFASLAAAAFRFLRPVVSAASEKWIDVASLSELTGSVPLARKIVVEQVAGWAVSTGEQNVYVLPAKNNEVLSAICPHEGCEVSWEGETNRFSCPCHESHFAADGSRMAGPAGHGLDPLPQRVQDGKLQVQYRLSGHNSEERKTGA